MSVSGITSEFRQRKGPRQRRATHTIDAVFDALTRILEKSVEPFAFNTNHLAEKAGISIGSLYQYFPNKQSVVLALSERYLKRRLEALRSRWMEYQRAHPRATPAETIDQLIDWIVESKQAKKSFELNLLRGFIRVGNLELLSRMDQVMVAWVEGMLEPHFPQWSQGDRHWKAMVLYQAVRGVLVSAQWNSEFFENGPRIRTELKSLVSVYLQN